jgi:hypothetical protein
MYTRLFAGLGQIVSRHGQVSDRTPPETPDTPDSARRFLLTGGAAVIASGLLVGLPSSAEAHWDDRRRRHDWDDRRRRRRRRRWDDGRFHHRRRRHRRRRRRRDNACIYFEPIGWFCF